MNQAALDRYKEIEEVKQAARGVVIRQLSDEMTQAAKDAVPHPEYSQFWNTITRDVTLGDIPGTVQKALVNDLEDRTKVLDPVTELPLELYHLDSWGEPQRIKSPERQQIEKELREYVKTTWYPKKIQGDNFGEYGGMYSTAIPIAGYRGRNLEEAKAILDILLLSVLMEKNQQHLYPNATQEFVATTKKLEQIREGLPKYIKPTDKDRAINRLLAYVPDNRKEEFRVALQNKTIEQINAGINIRRQKYADATAAKLKAAEDEAVAAMPKPKAKGGWFGRSRKVRSRKTRKQRKN